MNYATSYHIGDISKTRRKTAKATAPTVGAVRPLDATAKRCGGNTERPTQIRSSEPVANDFLKTTFLPKLRDTETTPTDRKAKKTERDFYSSLSRLAQHYQIQPMPTSQFDYPYNVALSLSDLRQQLKAKITNWDNIRIVQEGTRTYIITEERYCTSSTLFYIPVIPLYRMLSDKTKRKTAQLLVSVCAYLYHIADIPYYRQEDSYLYWQYEMLSEWVEQDENEESAHYKDELKQAEWVGEKIEQKIFNRKNLTCFKQRLAQFIPIDDFDKECLQTAQNAFTLFEKFPDEKYYRNASAKSMEDEDPDFDNILSMDKYVSFFADDKGWLAESLFETINAEFGEYGDMEEPAIFKCFDGRSLASNTLDFEEQLFTLLDDLIYLLRNYKYKKQ